ncbi:protein bric-a-brac 2 isoform X7 [Penaeus vannamei]|uniref:protein bric-a-brac 2 isoform X7 n=1 Tax=Penaeus vannamei TaxID=6689 RepID=UPI00387F7022
MGSEQHYSLRWNDYTVKIVTAFQSLRDEEDFVDVTVACDGHSYSAHKMVLSACSPYFRALLRANPCQHPIVILKDVGHVELERLLEFMYNGEVSIAQDQLAAFLKTAENLKIRGLAGSSDEMDQAGLHRPDVSYSYSSCAIGGGGTSGRSSPSAGYAPSQGSKDDEIVGDGSGGYHTRPESPPSKRRKRTSAPAAGHADSNTASHTTDVVGETPVEVDSGGTLGGGSIPGEDDLRLDRRELKSEPGDAMTEVYSESSEISTDPQSHSGEALDPRQSVMYPLAMPGPSGSAGGQDSVGPHEPGGGGARVKQESGEVLEVWWGEPGGAVGSSGRAPPPLPAAAAVTSSTPPPPPLPTPTAITSPSSTPSTTTTRVPEVPTWTPFSPPPMAPLSHLESLTHTTFTRVGDVVVGAGGAATEAAVAVGGRALAVNRPWFPCPQCGKRFRTRVTLSRHEKIHTGNAFPCPVCPKVFYQVSNVKYHVTAVHGRQYEPPPRSQESAL